MICTGLLALSCLFAADGHEQANPLFRELLRPGVPLGPKDDAPLPPPTLADGLDAAAQKAILQAVAEKKKYDLDQLLQMSVTAPFVWETSERKQTVPTMARALAVDVWFVAHGPLKGIGSKDFLEKALASGQKDSKVHILGEAELAKRNIKPAAEGSVEERYSHVVFSLLNQVELSVTSRTLLSRTPDSLLFASRLDPRFLGDPEFPNQWHPLRGAGPSQPYVGAGAYVKISRLDPKSAGQEGALFVESHLVFLEPKDWFPQGANLLRSKIPALVQDQVRSFRKEVSKLKE